MFDTGSNEEQVITTLTTKSAKKRHVFLIILSVKDLDNIFLALL